MPRIVIDGNIGSGKTTQLDLLEKKGWTVQREPIANWPLEAFYKDPSRWAFYFHMVILQTLRPIETTRPVIYERGLMASRWVFWPLMVSKGLVTSGEEKTYAIFYEQLSWFPDVYIFLAKNLDLAWSHIQKRHQSGDSGVTRKYLNELDEGYTIMLRNNVPCKVHIVDANRTPEEIHEEICQLLKVNELFINNEERDKVQAKGGRRWKMPCASAEQLCCVS
jgi:deoxyadenosine/deoxycytidine kinase